jgi:hypothetical protein
LRLLVFIASLGLLTACAPVKQQPPAEPGGPKAQTMKPKARFDGLTVLSTNAPPDRDKIRERHRYDRAIKPTTLDGVRYYFYEPGEGRSVVGFAFLNQGSPTVNPVGLRKRGARREYAFLFPDRARENIYLAINDDVKLSGRFSHDNMFRELHFFPRRQLPSLNIDHAKGLLRVTLPTGEPVVFDRHSKELVGGVLEERPIDFNLSRHQRRNPQVRYRGEYLAITVDQRGEAPRRASIWGEKKYAEVHYPAKYAKPCRLSPKHIWDQRPKPGDNDPKLHMLHSSDASLFSVIERRCNWDLSELKQVSPILVEAEDR